jgi:hypothetical protein
MGFDPHIRFLKPERRVELMLPTYAPATEEFIAPASEILALGDNPRRRL